jgi:hypothetical protein
MKKRKKTKRTPEEIRAERERYDRVTELLRRRIDPYLHRVQPRRESS